MTFARDAGLLKAHITEGQFFILGGQIAYFADVGDTCRAPNGETDAQLRVVYSNGTESNLLRLSRPHRFPVPLEQVGSNLTSAPLVLGA